MQEVKVTLPSKHGFNVPYGTRVGEIMREEEFLAISDRIVGAYVNNEVTSLSFKVEVNAHIRPVTLDSTDGARIYRRSLCFILTVASVELFPERRLVIGHSLGDSYYYHYDGFDRIEERDLEKIEERMRLLIKENLPIQRRVLSYTDAIAFLQSTGRQTSAQLLGHRNESKVPVYECRSFCDISHGPLVPETGVLRNFELLGYPPGFLLRYPAPESPGTIKPFVNQPVVFSIFQEYKSWGKILGVSSAGQLNELVRSGKMDDFIRVAEALHDRKIAEIADKIRSRKESVRLVLIAGPSSSGKTTFTKKLEIQLRVLGFLPVSLSTDDYFLPRELTPKDEKGDYDFESISALDIEGLNTDLNDLLAGGEVEIPNFDFKTGRRKTPGRGKRLQLEDRSLILIEGIHGLNPALTAEVPKEQTFKVYVSALSQLNIDDHNRIPTTDLRLIRRIVRDRQFRGYSALDTLSRWPSVKRGENRDIFPFEGNADVAFNSALDYELPILKPFVEPLLGTVKPQDEVYSETLRIVAFLKNFVGIPQGLVPPYSILREFIGGSGFKY